MAIHLGIDILLNEKLHLLQGKRIALLANGASVDGRLNFTPHLLKNHPDVNLVKLFSPEHGLYGTAQDMESISSASDRETGLEVISLYGKTLDSLRPKAADLKDIDVLICDLQDVGARYYTYIYTLALCLEASAKLGKSVLVCDRPNPLNGIEIEGNILNRKFASFVGLYPLPVRHGMTIGELAGYFNETERLGCDLTVIPMKGWRRDMYFDQTGLTWLAPSPNMPTLNTAIVYPGMCLIEATELSEGRGTTMPFEWVGAPFIRAHELTDALNALKLAGVQFRAIHFKPGFNKHQGRECPGVHIHVTDRKAFKPYRTGLYLLKTIADLYPKDFAWRHAPYEFVSDTPAIDLLTGGDDFRKLVEGRNDLQDWMNAWKKDEETFRARRGNYLMYE